MGKGKTRLKSLKIIMAVGKCDVSYNIGQFKKKRLLDNSTSSFAYKLLIRPMTNLVNVSI